VWLDDLDERNVRRLIELPPAGYIIRCPVITAASVARLPYVRGVFPVPPGVKMLAFDHSAPDPSPYRPVVVEASVEAEAESLKLNLQSISADGVVSESTTNHVARYQALLTELDALTLASFDLVYEIVAIDTPRPSSERQAQLLAQVGQEATLPATNTDYNAFLLSRGIPSTSNTFDNTRVGIIDTGFDNGLFDYASIHPDFRLTFGGQQITTVIEPQTLWVSYLDLDWHGTIVTSAITGYPGPLPTRAEPTNNYRYGLGVAPTVRCVPDRIFRCNSPAPGLSLDSEIKTLAEGHGVNITNLSFNDGGQASGLNHGGGCGYGQGSVDVDSRARVNAVLSVVAAGNSTEGCPGNYVRTPATAKNAIAVGSTDNFTVDYGDGGPTGSVCDWNKYPPSYQPPVTQDARRIPDYSAHGYPTSGGSITPVKPDLVAPSTRVTGPKSRGPDPNPNNDCIPPSNLCNSSVASPDGVTYVMWDGTSFAAPGASAVFLTVTSVSPTDGGFVVVYPNPGTRPLLSFVSVDPGERGLANGGAFPVGTDPSLQMTAVYGTCCGHGTSHLVVDVMGYYTP
jgi:hypothetical protein